MASKKKKKKWWLVTTAILGCVLVLKLSLSRSFEDWCGRRRTQKAGTCVLQEPQEEDLEGSKHFLWLQDYLAGEMYIFYIRHSQNVGGKVVKPSSWLQVKNYVHVSKRSSYKDPAWNTRKCIPPSFSLAFPLPLCLLSLLLSTLSTSLFLDKSAFSALQSTWYMVFYASELHIL